MRTGIACGRWRVVLRLRRLRMPVHLSLRGGVVQGKIGRRRVPLLLIPGWGSGGGRGLGLWMRCKGLGGGRRMLGLLRWGFGLPSFGDPWSGCRDVETRRCGLGLCLWGRRGGGWRLGGRGHRLRSRRYLILLSFCWSLGGEGWKSQRPVWLEGRRHICIEGSVFGRWLGGGTLQGGACRIWREWRLSSQCGRDWRSRMVRLEKR